MKVKLVQIDGKLPNLALMKLSAFLKNRGDDVAITRDTSHGLFEPTYDAVYASAIFKFSGDKIERLRRTYPYAIIGGTGTDSQAQVEGITSEFDGLDYSLWPTYTASLGFTQRGCRLSCKFCVVPAKEGKNRTVATISDIWRGEGHPKHLHLLDNDFFGQPEDQWRERVREIIDGDFKVCLNQGINVRLLNQEGAEALAAMKMRDNEFKERRIYTAWDNLKDEEIFFRGVDLLTKAGIRPAQIMPYMLVGYDKRETWDRIWHRFNRMVASGIEPYPMVFDCRAVNPSLYRELKKFQRWVVTGLYRAVPFADYDASRKGSQAERDLQMELL
jgi:hypothetical protein